MPLEAEEGTYSALTIVTKECGHFQKEALGFVIGGISSFIPLFSLPMYLHHSVARREGNVHPVLLPRYQKLYFITQPLSSVVSHGDERRYLFLSQCRRLHGHEHEVTGIISIAECNLVRDIHFRVEREDGSSG